MKKSIKTFEEVSNLKAYILTSDGTRDSVGLDKIALNEEGIKRALIYEADILGQEVLKESIKIDFDKETIYYSYKDFDGEIIDSMKWKFFTVDVV